MKVVITFTFYCDNLWRLEKQVYGSGKAWKTRNCYSYFVATLKRTCMCVCVVFHLSDKEWTVVGYEDARLSSAVETIKMAK